MKRPLGHGPLPYSFCFHYIVGKLIYLPALRFIWCIIDHYFEWHSVLTAQAYKICVCFVYFSRNHSDDIHAWCSNLLMCSYLWLLASDMLIWIFLDSELYMVFYVRTAGLSSWFLVLTISSGLMVLYVIIVLISINISNKPFEILILSALMLMLSMWGKLRNQQAAFGNPKCSIIICTGMKRIKSNS